MKTYHISASGKPATCHAVKRACPRAHFNSFIEARVAAVETTLPDNILHKNALAASIVNAPSDILEVTDAEGKTFIQRWENLEKNLLDTTENLVTPEEWAESVIDADFGRHRGTTVGYAKPDTLEEIFQVNKPEDIEKYEKQNMIPVISVYTRNGGGNREDYWKEIKSMQENPHYLGDEDDIYDNTYASFYFKVPDEKLEEFKETNKRARTVRQHKAAASLIEIFKSDPRKAMSLFPINKDTQALIDDLRHKQTQLIQEKTQNTHLAYGNPLTRNVSSNLVNGSDEETQVNVHQLQHEIKKVLSGEITKASQLSAPATLTASSYFEAVDTIKNFESNQKERNVLIEKLDTIDPALAKSAKKLLQVNEPQKQEYKKRQIEKRDEYRKQFEKYLLQLNRYAESIDALLENKKQISYLRDNVNYPENPETLR